MRISAGTSGGSKPKTYGANDDAHVCSLRFSKAQNYGEDGLIGLFKPFQVFAVRARSARRLISSTNCCLLPAGSPLNAGIQ